MPISLSALQQSQSELYEHHANECEPDDTKYCDEEGAAAVLVENSPSCCDDGSLRVERYKRPWWLGGRRGPCEMRHRRSLPQRRRNVPPLPDDHPTDAATVKQRRQRQLAVGLLFACTVLVFADQNLMSPNLTAIAKHFGFNDEQRDRKLGGDIALAFFVLGAPAAFVIGILADHYDRTLLFSATIIAGEGACFATYWVETYSQLYVCRAITGFSMGGALPLVYSILGDMFAAHDRHVAGSYVGIGMGIGISLGQGIAGFVGPTLGWRVPFLVISIPALICAIAFYCLVQDPERGGMEEAVRNRQTTTATRQLSLLDDQEEDSTTQLESSSTRGELTSLVELSQLESDDNGQSAQRWPNDHTLLQQSTTSASLSEKDSAGFNLRVHWAAFKSLVSTPTVALALLQVNTADCN